MRIVLDALSHSGQAAMTLNTIWYRRALERFKTEPTHWLIIELKCKPVFGSGTTLFEPQPACELMRSYHSVDPRFMGWVVSKFNCPMCVKAARSYLDQYDVRELCL